ncbi:MAG: hypothetical protein QXL94_02365 [Candidatus Parvarchaeum sp.]
MVKSNSFLFPAWRIKLLKKSDILLILLEFILSTIFLALSYAIYNIYLKGVGVGLLIAWVTSVIVYLFKKEAMK